MQRKANDAQIERFLSALKRDLTYRQTIATKIAEEKIGKKLTPAQRKTLPKTREYKSAMRRLQRYVTTGAEKRSIERAPVAAKRQVRQIARAVPLPPLEPVRIPAREIYHRGHREEKPKQKKDLLPVYRESRLTTDLYELRAIIGFFDGNTREAAKRLDVDWRLLDLASQGTSITRAMGAGRIDEGVERLYGQLSEDEIQDIQDFSDLLHDLPDWRIGLILDDMANGDTTFSDWIDAWHDDDMAIDASESEFWALWRAAYERLARK